MIKCVNVGSASLLESLETARSGSRSIILPEGEDSRVVAAAVQVVAGYSIVYLLARRKPDSLVASREGGFRTATLLDLPQPRAENGGNRIPERGAPPA